MQLKKIIAALLLGTAGLPAFAQIDKAATDAFLKRVVKDRATAFTCEYLPADNGKDVFEIESNGNRIVLRGNNGVSVASALNYYLRNYCNSIITWNGTNLHLPAVLPVVKEKEHHVTPYKYRYYINYCTFQYSMSWWNWERWQQEIDWMAMNGINMPLALTGEEAIWQEVYKEMGFTDAELDKFFSGPAYFSWLWMGNIDAWGGPLPQHWKDSHKVLQQKILAAERSMGMLPILPAFTGHVPPAFKDKYPNEIVKPTNWDAGFPDVYILDPNSPMFDKIGKKFLEAQTKAFGTDHFYSADTFNENVPPSSDSSFLDAMSRKVYASMAAADPKAVWVMQGWMFHYNSSYWHQPQIRALLNAVPDDRMIVLDLYSESHPEWKNTQAYYGKPWIWNMLHNFGGNTGMWGGMDAAAHDPATALHDPASGKMSGIGLTPEGIEQNPALYQLMIDNVWRDQPINVDTWLQSYAKQRYGVENEAVNKAWQILYHTVYIGGPTEGAPESIIVARPTLDIAAERVKTKLEYDPAKVVPAWDLFISAAAQVKPTEGFKYDLVDVTRQVLGNYASPLQQRVAAAYRNKDIAAFKQYSKQFLELLDDMDMLLGTQEGFLLGKWVSDARSNGITPAEQDLYEFNAKDLVTLWGDKDSPVHEYSNRQWNGLIKGFYKPRWQQFFTLLETSLKKGETADLKAFEEQVKAFEWKWANGHDKYAVKPQGDPVKAAIELHKKYRKMM